MAMNKEAAVEKARHDLSSRINVKATEIAEVSVDETDFPDMALGAPIEDEMSGQMMTRGWRIRLAAKGEEYEYRADKNQVRLYGFQGDNFLI